MWFSIWYSCKIKARSLVIRFSSIWCHHLLESDFPSKYSNSKRSRISSMCDVVFVIVCEPTTTETEMEPRHCCTHATLHLFLIHKKNPTAVGWRAWCAQTHFPTHIHIWKCTQNTHILSKYTYTDFTCERDRMRMLTCLREIDMFDIFG